MDRSERYADFVADFSVRSLLGLVAGMAEESGEVIALVTKHLFHGRAIARDEVVKELGDVLFYLTAVANTFDIPLWELQNENERKLRARFPKGPAGAGEGVR